MPNQPKTDVRLIEVPEDPYRVRAARTVLADLQRELLELKGPCSNSRCSLHYAHSGPCETVAQAKAKAVPHTVRVEDELWQAAAEEANRRGESLSEAMRRFLKRYSKGAPRAHQTPEGRI